MENSERLISNILSQCHKMIGNIDRFMSKEDRVFEHFLLAVQKVEVLANRCIDKKTGKVAATHGVFRAIGRSTGRLLSAYSIAEALSKKFRWAIRRRITEIGTSQKRVQLEDQKSQIIGLSDLHLEKPLKATMLVLIGEVEREIKNPLQVSLVASLGEVA